METPWSVVRKIVVLGREVRIWICDTGNGMTILIEGGDKGHIGAVAVAGMPFTMDVSGEETFQEVCMTFPEHREDVVSRQWAKAVSAVYPGPVVVEAGVHYDGIGKAEIQEILEALEAELQQVLRLIESSSDA